MRLTGGTDRGRRAAQGAARAAYPSHGRQRSGRPSSTSWAHPRTAPCWIWFAGTGALGMEALSNRGAPRAVFIERDRNALSALRQNLRELSLGGRSTVIGADVRTGLRRLAASLGREDKFSWVFMDPPYANETDFAFWVSSRSAAC